MKRTPLKRKSPLKAKKTLRRNSSRKPTKKPVQRRTGAKKPKSKRVKTLKKKLWTVFSRYIRLNYADHAGYVTCCDSGETAHWTATHCGHLFHGTERNSNLGGNELWYYENNFAPQSADGNIFNKDDAAKKYTIYAIKKYGMEEVERMYKMRHTVRRWTEEELQEKYEHYKAEVERMGG